MQKASKASDALVIDNLLRGQYCWLLLTPSIVSDDLPLVHPCHSHCVHMLLS